MGYKESTNLKLKNIFNQYGIKTTIDVAYTALKNKNYNKDFDFYTSFHGEISETVLECLLEDYLKKNKIQDFILAKGLILKDLDNLDSKFSTEIDLTVFTPECIYLFECKSYSGKNKLSKDGLITREDGKQFDVFRQSLLHRDVLMKVFTPFLRVGGRPEVKMVFFNFSTGNFNDVRSLNAKKKMLLCNEKNVLKIFDFNQGRDNWNVKAMRTSVERLLKASEKARDAHVKYVQSLHRR